MTVFLVISSRRGRRGEVDILLVVTFPQHPSDEDADHLGRFHKQKSNKKLHPACCM